MTDDPAFAGVLVFLLVFLRVRGQQHLQNQNAPGHQAETGSEDNICRPRSSFRGEIHGVLLCKDLSIVLDNLDVTATTTVDDVTNPPPVDPSMPLC